MGATRKHLRRGIVAIIVGVVATVVMSWLAMSTLLFRSFEDAFIDTDFHVIATSDQCVWKSSFLEQYWVTVMLCDLTSNKPDVELDTRDHHRVHLADLAAFPEFIRSRMFLQQEADDVIIIAAGWPMRSLICDTRIEPGAYPAFRECRYLWRCATLSQSDH